MKSLIKKVDEFAGRHYNKLMLSLAAVCIGGTLGLAACGDDEEGGGTNTKLITFNDEGYGSYTTPAGTFVECFRFDTYEGEDIVCVGTPAARQP